MALTVVDSDTTTTDGTEQTLVEETTAGVYNAFIDMTNLAGGTTPDIVRIRVYIKVLTGGTARVLIDKQYVGGLIGDNPIFHYAIPVAYYYKLTIDRDQGTDRAYDWHVTRV